MYLKQKMPTGRANIGVVSCNAGAWRDVSEKMNQTRLFSSFEYQPRWNLRRSCFRITRKN